MGRIRPNVSAAYRRELTTGRTSAILQLSDQSNGRFLVDGLPFARDTLTARVGGALKTNRIDLSATYEARAAAGQTRQLIAFGLGFE